MDTLEQSQQLAEEEIKQSRCCRDSLLPSSTLTLLTIAAVQNDCAVEHEWRPSLHGKYEESHGKLTAVTPSCNRSPLHLVISLNAMIRDSRKPLSDAFCLRLCAEPSLT